MDDLSHLRALVDELAKIAPWWSGFWMPVSEEVVEQFESKEQITLPPEFRSLLLEIGDRAPIPGQARGGFLPLLEAVEATTASGFLGPRNENFTHSGNRGVSLPWDDERDDYVQSPPLRGLLPIVDGGCDVTYHLVVTGEDRGRVWVFVPSGDPELRPTGQSVLPWYRRRLEKAMQPLREAAREKERLEQRVASDGGDAMAALRLGRQLLLLDTERAATLIEQAWLDRDTLSPTERTDGMRGVAELDLVRGRSDRIAEMNLQEDALLRCYAGVAAARDGHYREAEDLLSSGLTIPGPMRALTAIYIALAAMQRGAHDQAIHVLREAPASPYGYHLLARAFAHCGREEEARRAHRLACSARNRHPQWQPQRPSLAQYLMPPLPPADDHGKPW